MSPGGSAKAISFRFRRKATNPSWTGDCYYQQFIPGPSYLRRFLCVRRSHACYSGQPRWRFVGEPWLHARPFHYCGSIGPIEMLPDLDCNRVAVAWQETLRVGCGLRGLFGVDFILGNDQPWPVEVNPRYTASLEVLEYATRLQALAYALPSIIKVAQIGQTAFPRRAWERGWGGASRTAEPLSRSHAPPGNAVLDALRRGQSDTGTCIGKAVIFAPRRLIFPESGPWQVGSQSRHASRIRGHSTSRRNDRGMLANSHDFCPSLFKSTECGQKLRERAAETMKLLFA